MSSKLTFGHILENYKVSACCVPVFSLLLIILISTSVVQVDRLHAGLLKNGITGQVNLDTAYLPGRYMVGFWYQVISFPTTLNTIEFSDETPEEGVENLGKLASRDKDGKQVYLDISVQYRILPEKLPEIYKEMTILYEDVYISALRGKFQQAANNFQIAEAWQSYQEVGALLHQACEEVLAPRHAECWGLQLWGVRLQSQYEQALITTQVRKQAQSTEQAKKIQSSYKANTKVILAGYEKEETIIENGGVAEKLQIERAAKSESQAALISAESEVLKMVSEALQLPGRPVMNASELVQYQRILMLSSRKDVNFVVKSSSGYMQALDVPSR